MSEARERLKKLCERIEYLPAAPYWMARIEDAADIRQLLDENARLREAIEKPSNDPNGRGWASLVAGLEIITTTADKETAAARLEHWKVWALMHGEMFADKADALAEKLGLPVEREERQEVEEMVKELF